MPNDTTPAAVAKHGDKMIEVRIRFWTDGIADQEHAVEPKHAWTTGIVVMDTNKSHGITPNKPKPFNSILDLQSVLAEVLMEHGVTLHVHRKDRKLFQA